MKDGNVNEFLDNILRQEEAVMFHEKKYFFNPCCLESGTVYELVVDLWDENDQFVTNVFRSKSINQAGNLKLFLASPIWDGKTFWEAEQEMTWVDW